MADLSCGSRARTRLFAAPGSAIVPDQRDDAVTRARRNVDAARLTGRVPDKRDVALVRSADMDELNRIEAERKKAAMQAQARRRAPHDVLPPFACSPVAHCTAQATLAQCPEFVHTMDRLYMYNRP